MIELMVAIGLMALMMYMISTIFTKASGVFNLARATVEVHQNARAAYGMMLNDFAAAKLCEYEDKAGFFGFGWERTGPSVNDLPYNYTPAVTFTTLADQSGATPLVPGVTPQVALVRYCLAWDGGQATLKGDDPLTTAREETYTRPTYYLMKRVRFPQLPYYFVDMNEFSDQELMPDEVVASDVLALGVLAMRVRVYCKGEMLDALDYGHANVLDDATVEDIDGNKKWTLGPLAGGEDFRILAGDYAPKDPLAIAAAPSSDTQLSLASIGYDAGKAPKCSYRIENAVDLHAQPAWIELQDRGFDVAAGGYAANSTGAGEMLPMRVIEYTSDPGRVKEDCRMPYIVEITLELTDSKSLSRHTFCERFHIPSSEY